MMRQMTNIDHIYTCRDVSVCSYTTHKTHTVLTISGWSKNVINLKVTDNNINTIAIKHVNNKTVHRRQMTITEGIQLYFKCTVVYEEHLV